MKLTTSWQSITSYYWQHSSGAKVTFYLDAKYNTQNVETNKTKIDIRLRSVLNAGYISGTGYEFTCSYCPTVSGSEVWNFETETITSVSNQEIEHNADGTKKLNLTASLYNSYQGLNETISAEVELPTIPRATTCPNLDGYIESSVSISLNPASETFKHRIYYSYNGKTGYYPSSSTFFKNTGSLSLDSSFYSYTPKSSGTGSITLYTYTDNGTLVGSKIGTLTVRCDETKCKPTISVTIIDSNSTTTGLTGNNSKLVKGYSNAKITYTITAKNEATISSKTVNGTALGTSPYTINKVSTGSFEIKGTDSRGFTTTTTVNKDLINYMPLLITPDFYRTQPTTGEVSLTFTGNYWNGNFGSVANALTVTWQYKESTSSSWTTGGTISSSQYTLSNNKINSNGAISLGKIFDYQKIYNFRLSFSDKLVNSSVEKSVPKGKPAFWWNKDGLKVEGAIDATGAVTAKNFKGNTNGYTWDIGTSNTSSTKVPVINDTKIQYRTINTNVNTHYNNHTSNLNNATATGWYRFGDGASNRPTTMAGWGVVVVQNDGSWVFQTAYGTFSTNGVRVAHRGYINGSWTEWEYLDNRRRLIYDTPLKGGQSVVLSNVKRYLDVYFTMTHSSGDLTGKYTIDTAVKNVTYGSVMLLCHDSSNGLEYYVSESFFDKTTNTFTHKRTGYCNISSGTYTNRNDNIGYIVYRIDTYD